MAFSIGTKVGFLHSRDQGVVSAILDHGLVMVRLSGEGMDIPVSVEDLFPLAAAPAAPTVLASPTTPTTPTGYRAPEKENDLGLQLAFVLLTDLRAYDIFLVNDTTFDVVFELELVAGEHPVLSASDRVPRREALPLGTMDQDLLNDRPRVRFSGSRSTTEGEGPRKSMQRKLKPRSFFRNLRHAPIIDRRACLIALLSSRELQPAPQAREDLQSYTRRHAPRRAPSPARKRASHDLEEAAGFPATLDLHAEAAFADGPPLRPEEIFPAQLRLFDRYLDDAIRFHLAKVTVIHGKGEGKLRQAIGKRLQGHPAVRSFRPSHDNGATVIYL